MGTYYKLLCALSLCFACILHSATAQEGIRFGNPVTAGTTTPDPNQLVLSTAPPPSDIAAGAEVFLVSGYEPFNRSGAGGNIDITVDRPGAKVLLVLSSYEKIQWQIKASASTTITGILVSGYHPPTVVSKLPVPTYLTKLPYAYQTENANFREVMSRLKAMLGVQRLDVFRGSYSLPKAIVITKPDPPRAELTAEGPMPESPQKNWSFDLLSSDYSNGRWTLTGPDNPNAKGKAYSDEGRIAASTSGTMAYKLRGEYLEIIDLSTNQIERPQLPANFPKFSWAMDLAYDSKRDIVTIVSLGGEGFLYRFDARKNTWIDFRSLNNIDLFSLAYDQKSDRYVAWAESGNLLFISGTGEALFTKNLATRMKGFGRLYDAGNGRTPRLTLVPNGDDLALVYIKNQAVLRIWSYNLKTDQVTLTY